MLFLVLFACDMPTPPSAEPEVAKSKCAVDVTTLAGSQWVYQAPQAVGPAKLPAPASRGRSKG